MAAGQRRQVIGLGFGAPVAIGSLGPFDAQRAERRFQAGLVAGQEPAALQGLAHPQAGAVAPPHLAQGGGQLGWQQRRDQGAQATLLHRDR